MSVDDSFNEWRQRHKAAHEAWASGRTTKEIAHMLDVTIETARKHKKKWAREHVKHLIPEAISALRSAGFSDDVISVLLDARVSRVTHVSWAEKRKEIEKLPFIDRSVDELELNMRAANTLKRLSVTTIGELCDIPEWKLRATKGCGKETVSEIIEELARHGLKLAN